MVFVLQLVQRKALKLSSVRHFVLDECDKMLESVGESAGNVPANACF